MDASLEQAASESRMQSLDGEQLSFLGRHGIRPEHLFDGTGKSKAVRTTAMEAE
jgi:hypothetical protein